MKAKHWQPNGKVCSMTNLVDGNGEIVNYFLNGKKSLIESFKTENLMEQWLNIMNPAVMSKAIFNKGVREGKKFFIMKMV